MAYTLLSPLDAGDPVTYTNAAADGNKYANSGSERLLVRNAHATDARQITIQSVACSHGRQGNEVVSVDAQETLVLGPFAAGLYNQASGTDAGTVLIDTDNHADVSFAVLS